MKKLFYLASVAIVALVMGACNGVTPSEPNVYIQYAVDGSELYYVTYVPEGNDGHSGKNIFNQRKGEYVFNGKKYHMYSIPRGTWDIYIEWYDSSRYSGMDNERVTVNTKANEWVRLDYRGGGYWTYQGSGAMY